MLIVAHRPPFESLPSVPEGPPVQQQPQLGLWCLQTPADPHEADPLQLHQVLLNEQYICNSGSVQDPSSDSYSNELIITSDESNHYALYMVILI